MFDFYLLFVSPISAWHIDKIHYYYYYYYHYYYYCYYYYYITTYYLAVC